MALQVQLREREREKNDPQRHLLSQQLVGGMDVHAKLIFCLSDPSERLSKGRKNKTKRSEPTETGGKTPMNSFVFLGFFFVNMNLLVSTQQTTQQAHLINCH